MAETKGKAIEEGHLLDIRVIDARNIGIGQAAVRIVPHHAEILLHVRLRNRGRQVHRNGPRTVRGKMELPEKPRIAIPIFIEPHIEAHGLVGLVLNIKSPILKLLSERNEVSSIGVDARII